MHDIICPHCGEKCIARDVVFDFSPYILSLISQESNYGVLQEHGFKYYVDEEDILTHPDPSNDTPLYIDNKLGPAARGGKFYQYRVTNDMIFKYIAAKTGIDAISLAKELNAISQGGSSYSGRVNYNAVITSYVRKVYYNCFSSAEASLGNFDIRSSIGSVIIEMLCQINDNRAGGVTAGVRMFCEKMNAGRPNYYVPDILFVFNANGQVDKKYKCCRCCNVRFAAEFGYYKMVPVTLLGSHYSGKTSLLLALLWCIRNKSPFNGDNANFQVSTLTDDPDLAAFNKNISNYMKGLVPEKTDFTRVPILSLLINNIIYTFTDWPGEAFVNSSENSMDFAYDSRRIIADSRHFIFCLEPLQIAPDLQTGDRRENVDFDENTLLRRFNDHVSLANLGKVRSITFVANKFDMFIDDGYPGTEEIRSLIENLTESDVYDNSGSWNPRAWEDITKKTFLFIRGQLPTLAPKAQAAYAANNICFIPASPYGRPADMNRPEEIKRGYFVGLPLLHILKCDGIIK